MDYRRLVLEPGDVVTAWGVMVLDVEGLWFQPSLPVRSAALHPHWSGAVPVRDASMDLVAHRREQGPLMRGLATVAARWNGQGLDVVEQIPQPPQLQRPPGRPDATPPCPPPPGGWPPGTQDDLECDYTALRRTGAVVASAIFRPSAAQAVLVIAAGDVALVEAALRPQLGARLCVVPSRFSRAKSTQQPIFSLHGRRRGRCTSTARQPTARDSRT